MVTWSRSADPPEGLFSSEQLEARKKWEQHLKDNGWTIMRSSDQTVDVRLGAPKKLSLWQRLLSRLRRIFRRDQHERVVFKMPTAPTAPKFYLAGSDEDPFVQFCRWLETQPAVTDWRTTDGTPFNVYMRGLIHGRLFEEACKSFEELRALVEAEIARGS